MIQLNRKKIIILFITIFIIASLFTLLSSNNLRISYYVYKTNIKNKLKIVHLTDLHNAEFDTNNNELIKMVKEQSPDMIVITGDMLNKDDSNLEIIINLVTELVNIAPVYYGYGNHEVEWIERYDRDLNQELTMAGAIVLNNEYVDININGNDIRIGGYMGYYRQPGMLTTDKNEIEIENKFFDDFENTDRFKILLNHIPTQWVDWEYIDKISIDLIFSGHYHGGAIYIPLIDRGLYAPYVGWFPKNIKGIFKGERATCILSAGLGSEHNIPRINNPPEIVVVDLK